MAMARTLIIECLSTILALVRHLVVGYFIVLLDIGEPFWREFGFQHTIVKELPFHFHILAHGTVRHRFHNIRNDGFEGFPFLFIYVDVCVADSLPPEGTMKGHKLLFVEIDDFNVFIRSQFQTRIRAIQFLADTLPASSIVKWFLFHIQLNDGLIWRKAFYTVQSCDDDDIIRWRHISCLFNPVRTC